MVLSYFIIVWGQVAWRDGVESIFSVMDRLDQPLKSIHQQNRMDAFEWISTVYEGWVIVSHTQVQHIYQKHHLIVSLFTFASKSSACFQSLSVKILGTVYRFENKHLKPLDSLCIMNWCGGNNTTGAMLQYKWHTFPLLNYNHY